jgi:hypothetical protein
MKDENEKQIVDAVIPPMEEVFSYKLVADNVNPNESIIEKSGIKSRFTLVEIQASIEKLLKLRREMDAQRVLEEAKIANYRSFHPIVDTLTPEEVFAISKFRDSQLLKEATTSKIKEIDDVLAEYNKEMESIFLYTGLKSTYNKN